MNNSQQLMSLIKNKAKQINISTQILLNRYFMERFLELIANSKYKENFILKGGVLISTLVGVDKRTTNDMDFAFKNKSISVTEITNLLNDVIDDMFTITKIEHIRENQDSFGLRVFFNAQFENIKTIIHIDIVKYEEIIPSERLFGYPLLLEDRSIGIYCYEVET
ncbi:MAG: nucleotidyl transferase AbiEii/AbiGii toxin family protein, partial [Bacillales bacterium]|nr:nucleotidyl transferase AbiEii/AbiGii toxin family protein [Bacillales bacterium]